MNISAQSVYTIPLGLSFLDVLANGLLRMQATDKRNIALSEFHILLPTRRSVRGLRDAFLRQTKGQPLLLPKLSAIGDIDGEELDLRMAGLVPDHDIIDIPNAISPLQRRIILSGFIRDAVPSASTTELSLMMADALGRFMDQVHTENLNMDDLTDLVPDDYAAHWGLTLNVLQLLQTRWQDKLTSLRLIDGSDRRNRLLKALNTYWTNQPPGKPVIAAGITGSIPSVAKLLRQISQFEHGSVVLHGLDQMMNSSSWDNISDTHPQAAFKQLLSYAGILREDVRPWPYLEEGTILNQPKSLLTSHIMQPADTISQWLDHSFQNKEHINHCLETIKRYTCATPHEEAMTISLILRETLETPDKTAMVVTPDRNLARRISAMMLRWNISVDDSAGCALTSLNLGSYLLNIIDMICSDFSSVETLCVLKNPLCQLGMDKNEKEKLLTSFEKEWRAQGRIPITHILYQHLITHIQPLLTLNDIEIVPFARIASAHIACIEKTTEETNGDRDSALQKLWCGEAGEAAALFLTDLMQQAPFMPDMNLHQYRNVIKHLLDSVTVRPVYSTHPRLSILGPIESRLLNADVTILCGLNEGTWPARGQNDPWMSRPMRMRFGLPSTEQHIGMSAHDFCYALCNKNTVLTRSSSVENTPSSASRWLQRLDAYLLSIGISPDSISDNRHLSIARTLDSPLTIQAAERPMPCPDIQDRPKEFSVTSVERLMKNPYRFYAEKILKIRPQEPLVSDNKARALGTFLHDVLYQFCKEYKQRLPKDSHAILIEIAQNTRSNHDIDDNTWFTILPQVEKSLADFLQNESIWREDFHPVLLEEAGEIKIRTQKETYRLYSRADRIDRDHNGDIAIIDYKTGQLPTRTAIKSGLAPQLPLEGLIAQLGGFPILPPQESPKVSRLRLVKVLGSYKTVDSVSRNANDAEKWIDSAQDSFTALLEAYESPVTPYLYIAKHHNDKRHDDRAYAHLGRLAEWNVIGDDDQESDEQESDDS